MIWSAAYFNRTLSRLRHLGLGNIADQACGVSRIGVLGHSIYTFRRFKKTLAVENTDKRTSASVIAVEG